MSIGAKLQERRKELGITRNDLARRTQTSIEEIEKFELGTYDNDLLDLKKLCDVLGVSANKILGLTQ